MNWQLSTGSWLPIRFLSRTLNWQLSTVSQLPIRKSNHKRYMKWTGNWQLAAGCQFDFYQELWIGNCQLSASCQFDESIIRAIWNEFATVNWQLAANSISIKNFELATVSQMPFRWSYHKVYMKWIGNCQLAAGCQLDFYQELWIGNCQLSACCQFDESIIRAIWNELATVSQMPFRWSYHKVYMKWIDNCQLAAGCQIRFLSRTLNWQLSTVSQLPIR